MEIRRTPRLSVKRAVYSTEGRMRTGGTVLNLSEGGCAVEGGERVRPSERLGLRLVLTEDEPPLFVDEARVCWTAEGRFGVEFLVLSAEARARLRAFLRSRFEAGIVAELRQRPRYLVGLPVAFWGWRVGGLGETVNVSKKGCAVQSDVVVPMNVSLRLLVTSAAFESLVMINVARVRWSRDRQFGVEFTSVQPASQQVLQQILDSLAAEQGGI